MNVQQNTRALVEAALIVAITSIFAIIGTYIPLLTFILFLVPVAFIILGKRHGLKYQILAIIASAVIVGSLTEPLSSLLILIYFGIMAAVMGYMMKKEYTPVKVWAGGTVASLVASVMMLALISLITGINVVDRFIEAFGQSMTITMEFYSSMGIDAERLQGMREMGESFVRLMGMVIPAGVIFSAVFFSYINYLITAFVLNRIGHKTETFPPLRYFRLPKSIIMGTLIIMLLTALTRYLNIVHYETLVINVFYIFSMLFFLQGLAVVSYWITAYNLKKPLRIIAYILVFLNPMVGQIVITVGFVDVFTNFRRLSR